MLFQLTYFKESQLASNLIIKYLKICESSFTYMWFVQLNKWNARDFFGLKLWITTMIAGNVNLFVISKTESITSNYTLKLPSKFHIHSKVHARRLKFTHDNDSELFPRRISWISLLIDVEQYAVEVILDRHHVRELVNFWCIGKIIQIQRIFESRKEILMRRWYVLVLRS